MIPQTASIPALHTHLIQFISQLVQGLALVCNLLKDVPDYLCLLLIDSVVSILADIAVKIPLESTSI